ncbi:MAG: hypothetical protein ACK2UJ_20575, partial [Candidatus Promineifilaceae bacterium]
GKDSRVKATQQLSSSVFQHIISTGCLYWQTPCLESFTDFGSSCSSNDLAGDLAYWTNADPLLQYERHL